MAHRSQQIIWNSIVFIGTILITGLTSSCTHQPTGTRIAEVPLQAIEQEMATEQRSPDDTTRYRAAAQRTAITRLYDASGRELAHFEGEFISFSQDGQSLLAYADGDYSITQLYDLAGNKLASLNGGFRKLSQDGRWII